jgi:hypothetical protein
MNDRDMEKRAVEQMVLDQFLDSFLAITGCTVTEEWDGEAAQVEGSPDFIIGLNGKPFGIELTEIRGSFGIEPTEIRGLDDGWDYVHEAYRLAARKSASYSRRQMFRYPIALVMHSEKPPLSDIEDHLKDAIVPRDFEGLGFAEIWAVDFSNEYYTPGHPFRRADVFCFKPAKWFGFHRIGWWDRKPYG